MRQLIAVSVLLIVAFTIFRDRTPPDTTRTASTVISTDAPVTPVVPQKLTAAETKVQAAGGGEGYAGISLGKRL
jgi:hypothetical protein